MAGTEPHVANDQDLTAEWFAWLRSFSTDALQIQCDEWGYWRPADDPEINADLVMEKWEAACAELRARKEK